MHSAALDETSDIAAIGADAGHLRWGQSKQRRIRDQGYPGERRNKSDPGGRPGQNPTGPSSKTDGDRLSHSKQADRGGSGSRELVRPGAYGRTTANGERFRKGTLTAAHRTLPFGTKVRVTNLNNGRSVVVRINDRGPFRYHRVIDLAHGAASQLKMMHAGEVTVKLEILSKGD